MDQENRTDGDVVDLFGNPVEALRDPRGRPKFRKSAENQRLVISLRGAGFSHDEVAAFMGCDPKTLRKHFSRELDHGAKFLEGMAVQVLVEKMMAGNTSAAIKVREMARLQAPSPKRPAPTSKLGKKESALKDAHAVPDVWGNLLKDAETDGIH